MRQMLWKVVVLVTLLVGVKQMPSSIQLSWLFLFYIFCVGTNVMIYNMKLMDNGLPELDISKDAADIIMADPHSAEVYDVDEK